MNNSNDLNINDLIGKWVSPRVQSINAYAVPPAENMIKLDAMENPYKLPAELNSGWLQALSQCEINRYPDPQCVALKSRLHEVLDIPKRLEIVLGNGSDELILLLTLLLGGKDRTLLAPSPSFSMYKQIIETSGANFRAVALGQNFELVLDNMLENIQECQPSCIFLANPNNPTGNCFAERDIKEIIKAAPGLVVIDEAYFPFSGTSFINEIEKYNNVLVLRTLSKNGFAGLRLGLLIAPPQWANQLEKLRLPYNINSLTQVTAEYFLQHYNIVKSQANEIVKSRQNLFIKMKNLKNIQVFPSETNFLLFKVKDANRTDELLQEAGILIKNLHKPDHRQDPALENCLRVTIGNENENQTFFNALSNL